jgi:hypothetical protein
MSQMVAMFCDVDDFCKVFEPVYERRLLQSGQRQRRRSSQLSLSEIMTIIVSFHASHYRDFKHYYTDYVTMHLRSEFPTLVSYSRFVELMPRALVPLCSYLHTRKGRCTGITFVDSTPLAVCHNKRSNPYGQKTQTIHFPFIYDPSYPSFLTLISASQSPHSQLIIETMRRATTMDWKTLLAYISGSVDEELLLRNEYLVAENRIFSELAGFDTRSARMGVK